MIPPIGRGLGIPGDVTREEAERYLPLLLDAADTGRLAEELVTFYMARLGCDRATVVAVLTQVTDQLRLIRRREGGTPPS